MDRLEVLPSSVARVIPSTAGIKVVNVSATNKLKKQKLRHAVRPTLDEARTYANI